MTLRSLFGETSTPLEFRTWGQTVSDKYDNATHKVFNVRDYGAVGDGVADDTAAIQAAIDAAPRVTAGVVPSTVLLPPGVYRITDTINVEFKGVILEGHGIGNPADYTADPGAGTTIRWDGLVDGDMFYLRQNQNVVFRHMHLHGNDAAKPRAAVFCDGEAGTGNNTRIAWEHVRFGTWTWVPGTINTGRLKNGVIYGGTNANGDMFTFRNCTWSRIDEYGVHLPNTQSVWGAFYDCNFDRIDQAAVRTAASTTMVNVQFNRCSRDIWVNSTAKVNVVGFQSEHSGLLGLVDGSGGRLIIHGGFAVIGSGSVETHGLFYFDASAAGAGGGLTICDFGLLNQTASARTIRVRGNTSSQAGLLMARIPQSPVDLWDVQAGSSGAGLKVDIEDRQARTYRLLTASATLVTGDWEVPHLGGGVIVKSPDGTRWRLTVDNSGVVGATGL